MMKHVFEFAEDAVLVTLSPVDALLLLSEGVLPLTAESELMARLALEVAHEFGTADVAADQLAGWGQWLHRRVHSLVSEVDPPTGIDVATHALIAGLAGITLYGLVDGWQPDCQTAALDALLSGLELSVATYE